MVRHLEHKNVTHDPELKSHVIQVATALARQIRSGTVLAEIGFVSDLCRHLRKSLQAVVESVGEQESNINMVLQSSIEDCLLEIAKGVGSHSMLCKYCFSSNYNFIIACYSYQVRDSQTLYDLLAIFLEKLPPPGIVARATIGSLIILAHAISLASLSSSSHQAR